MSMRPAIALLRPQQWYKNIVIFAAVFFSREALSLADLSLSLAGFACLCLISSAGYIVNDIIDLERDARIRRNESDRSQAAQSSCGRDIAPRRHSCLSGLRARSCSRSRSSGAASRCSR